MSEAERLAQALEGAFHAWEHPSNEAVLKADAELRRLQRELGLADSMYKLVVLERDQAYREVEALRKALQGIAAMDEQQQRADDMGRAARIAHAALAARPGGRG